MRQPVVIGLADGSLQRISRYCCVRVRLHPQYEPLVMFYVADVVHEVVLGKPWLAAPIGIVIDWQNDTILVGKKTVLQSDSETYVQGSLMSASRFKRAAKRNP
ncbi:hypothetical protein DFQ26_002450, partial [Actinomortierella ambigua]